MVIDKGNYKLYKGDCLEVMDELIALGIKFDMILCDLPYGTTACRWDSVIPFDKLWDRYKNLITDKGCIALFGSEPFSSFLRTTNIDMYKYIAGQLGIKRMEFIVIPQFNSTIKDLLSEENVLIRNKKFNNGSTVESCLVERTYFPILYCMELKGNNVAYYFQSDVDVKDLINYLTEIQGKEE